MRRFFILLTFVLIASLVQTSEARKFALLVGVDSYVSVPSLKCCVNDMKTLKEALMKIGFEENDIQILVTGPNESKDLPTKRNIEKNISKILTNAQPDDMVFLALSGHGAQEGKNVYFCPLDVEVEDLPGTCVSINKVMDLFANKCSAQFKWLVVDACRNDPTQGPKGIGGKGLQVIPTPPAGIALFQSCAEGEQSWEDYDSGNGYFTKNLVAALSGEADSDHDGKLTLMEVCKWTTAKTKEQVSNTHNKSQRPYFSGSVSDFTLTEDVNVRKAQELAAEAQKAMDEENYELAIQKYDEAIALCPRFENWKRERNLAQRLLNGSQSGSQTVNSNEIIVPRDFATIAEAYKNAEDGGIITIQPGKYELSDTLYVDKNVTFRGKTGRAEDVVIDSPSANAFQITSGSPSFQNLTVSSGGEICGGFSITGGAPKLFRCIITSRKGDGMYVEGENANPQVESCTIKKCSRSGVYVFDNGLGIFKGCEIYGNMDSGIRVRKSGNPTFTGCKIHDDNYSGVYIEENGLGIFKDCDIYGNSNAEVEVRVSGNPNVTGCRIHDGKGCGLNIYDEGLGTFKECKIYGNLSGIQVRWSGNPTVTGCEIYDNKQAGAIVLSNGLGKYIDCEFYENTLSGIEVKESGNPTVTGCIIHNGKGCGLFVYDNGLGTFKDCEFYENVHPGIQVSKSGNPNVIRCKIHDGKSCGVYVYDKGMGTFNNNTLERNYRNNWVINSDAGKVTGSGNNPELPTR